MTSTTSRWTLRTPDAGAAKNLCQRLGVHPVLADLLAARGATDPEAARRLLNPTLADLLDPADLPDVELAVDRVTRAIESAEPILVYGDYDVDGVTGTTVLVSFLRLAGAKVDYTIPDRRKDGYGLSSPKIEAAAEAGTKLIISVDTGIAALRPAERARDLGVDLVICDHHLMAEEGLPIAVARVHPGLPGSRYANRFLCGAGVAFKLCWAIAQHLSAGTRVRPEFREYLLNAMAFVAMGTIADVVPLTGENRAIVSFGLRALSESRAPGVQALLQSADLAGDPLDASDIAFKVAPRINAAGRLGDATKAVELLLADDRATATRLAALLDRENRRRRAIEREIAEAARDQVLDIGGADLDGIVVADDGWHPGVVGIVASRLVEEFDRPAIVIAIEGERGRGSARTVPGIDVHAALSACSDLLEAFGGHAAAAGVEVRADRIDAFRARFAEAIAEQASGRPPTGLLVDLELKLAAVDRELATAVRRLGPFGQGHEEPLFCAREVEVVGAPRLLGARHIEAYLRQGKTSFRAMLWNRADIHDQLRDRARGGPGVSRAIDVAFRPVVTGRRGADAIELHVSDVVL